MRRMWFNGVAAAVTAAALLGAAEAPAAMITGSVPLVPSAGNTITYTTTNGTLSGATSLTFATSAIEVLNPGTGDLVVLTAGTPGTLVPGTVTVGSSNTISVGGFTFTFTGGAFGGNSLTPNAVAFQSTTGTLSGGGFDDTPAVLIISANQAGGPGNDVSAALTIASLQSVPEPASLALAGVAVAGLAVRRLRRKTA